MPQRGARSLILLAPVLVTALSGCGLWDSWKDRMAGGAPARTAHTYGNTHGIESIQPGHSLQPEQFNRNYQLTEPAPAPPIEPPPVPATRGGLAPTPPGGQNATAESSDEGSTLIKTLKSPRIFSPDGVRSIYDRFRGADDDSPTDDDGPIAGLDILHPQATTQACRHTQAEAAEPTPVRLGLPQTDSGHPLGRHHPLLESPPAAMQAGPSSFRHPLLADPTGVPYPVQ